MTPEETAAPYKVILSKIQEALGDRTSIEDQVDNQLICLVEEVGEVAKAWRRATGRARIYDDFEHVCEELADVIIVARLTFLILGENEDAHIQEKLRAIAVRGGR